MEFPYPYSCVHFPLSAILYELLNKATVKENTKDLYIYKVLLRLSSIFGRRNSKELLHIDMSRKAVLVGRRSGGAGGRFRYYKNCLICSLYLFLSCLLYMDS